MSVPKTLLQMAGAPAEPAPLDESALVLIDFQREYRDGKLPLHGVDAALDEGARLLKKTRLLGAPVIHIQHKGRPGGGLFDPDGPYFEISEPVRPVAGEHILDKSLPNAFAGTELHRLLGEFECSSLVIAGFMSHMCVSSTVRAALDLGYRCTVVDGAVTTRDLPDGRGGVIDAASLHRAEMAALSDRFAVVVPDSSAF